MGALLMAVAAGNAPLVMRFFAGTPGPPRLLAATALAGLLLAVVRPPLPLKVNGPFDSEPVISCIWCSSHRSLSRLDARC